jgi:hypothetical protein
MGDNCDNNTFRVHYSGGQFVDFRFHLHRGSASIDTLSPVCTSLQTWASMVQAAEQDDVSSFDTLGYGAFGAWWQTNLRDRSAMAGCFDDFKAFVAHIQ